MAIFTAPTLGGSIFGSGFADTIIGSENADTLIGSGANDQITGNAGDDIIFGDGSVTYAQAFASLGYSLTSFMGTVGASNGLQLTAMGTYGGQSVWRIRNASDTAEVVSILQSTSSGSGNGGGFSQQLALPPNSEIIILSNHLGTHRLVVNGRQVEVKALNSSAFNAAGLVTGVVDGNDTIDGGEGNDTIDGGGGTDTIHGGNGNDIITGGRGDDTMYGEAGDDTFLAEWANTRDIYHGGDGIDTFKIIGTEVQGYAQEIDLVTGTNNWGDIFTSIENITGGTGNDKFWGTAGDNTLTGETGNDLLDGRDGNDTLVGGEGDDILIGGNGLDTLVGGAGIDNLDGGAGADTLRGGDGNDVIAGGADKDTIYGDAGNDTIDAGSGSDSITGGAGADALNGNTGEDTAHYRNSTVGVDVSLLRGTGLLGDAEGDTLQLIENLSGSALDDILTGDNAVNRLTGLSGTDRLFGLGGDDYFLTGGGYDYVDGGDGIDTVTYEDSWGRVVVNLTTGINQYAEAARDVLVNVERVVGSRYDDTLTGDAGANRLTGGDGADVLNGMAGIDYLFGSAGNDRMTGGTEADVFVFNAGFGDDTITDFAAGVGRTDRIWLQAAGVTGQTAVEWSVVDSSAGAVISIVGQGSITLTGVTVAQLHADDFIFS
jgi:Ca2+-binding RTX toxin-like protein